jgi:hypothetical protein
MEPASAPQQVQLKQIVSHLRDMGPLCRVHGYARNHSGTLFAAAGRQFASIEPYLAFVAE